MQTGLHSTPFARPALRSTRVVVIDSSASAADAIADGLRADGCDVQVAYDSADGIDAVAQYHTDCVLIDIDMPRIDGIEVARCLREVHRKGLVLIGITGTRHAAGAVTSELSVFDHCLAKPLDVSAVRALLRLPRA
jgi:DNA-binding response OmpR family regulator